ncbi:hypothetical protein B2G74_33510 [Burkholderia sp. A27]|nr:hypothetical protein B2G74_33510 [Burkholderia sp. A27]
MSGVKPPFECLSELLDQRPKLADSRLIQLAYVARLEGLGRPAAGDPSRPFGPNVVNDRSQGEDTFE